MADLRALVAGLGYSDVRTLLNNGNIIFEAADPCRADAADRIEEALAARLGVSARVTILTAEELGVVVADDAMSDVAVDPSRLLVAFLGDPRGLARPARYPCAGVRFHRKDRRSRQNANGVRWIERHSRSVPTRTGRSRRIGTNSDRESLPVQRALQRRNEAGRACVTGVRPVPAVIRSPCCCRRWTAL
jgi:hypothetical protein